MSLFSFSARRLHVLLTPELLFSALTFIPDSFPEPRAFRVYGVPQIVALILLPLHQRNLR